MKPNTTIGYRSLPPDSVYALVVCGKNGKTLFSIRGDGVIEVDPDLKPDECAQKVLDALAMTIPQYLRKP